MNIYMTAVRFAFLILVYWLISEIFTILFRLIGLPIEKARFQVISLLTGCGFTTRESEMILSTRSRRRLARITMLFGYVFNLTIVSTLINMLVSIQISELGTRLLSMIIPLTVIIAIFAVSRTPKVRSWIERKLENIAGRVAGKANENSIVQLDQIGSGTIAQVNMKKVPDFLEGKPLAQTGIKTELNIVVLLYERGSDAPAVPTANTVFEPGDRLTLFGNNKTICRAFLANEYFLDKG